MRLFIFACVLLFSQAVSAQKIYGTVFTDRGDLLPFSSITVKGSSVGASANDKARFSISLAPGKYTVICQHVGYTAVEKSVTVSGDAEITFILAEQKLTMKDVVIKTGGEDPAYAIIRQAIKKRSFYQKQVNAFSCDLYSKDMVKLRNLPKRIFGQKIPDADRKSMGLDSAGQGIIYLSESISKIYTQQPDKIKLEVLSSRVSGSGGFGFTFPSFISLYTNNVMVFTSQINPRGFVSPIADGALGFYKYKFLGSFWEDGKEINSIRVTPRRSYEPLFSGIINISENDWRIHSFNLLLTKSSQLEIIDSLAISQIHVPVTTDTWRVKNQLLHFNFKQFGIDAIGNFLTVYSNYNVAPAFGKKFFDNIVIKYDTGVNKKSAAYWDSTRPVPLEKEEQKDYQVKDSIFHYNKDSVWSKTTVDSLNKRQGKLKITSLFMNGIRRTHYSKTNQFSWGIDPLLTNLEYNPAEGVVANLNGYYTRYSRKLKSTVRFEPNIRYGFNNTHLNPWASLVFRTRDFGTDKKLKRLSWAFSGGKRVSEFNKESTLTPLINSISVLFYGKNYIKTYENYFGNINFTKRYENGVRFYVNALYEDRIPLNNTTLYTFSKKDSSNITPNFPVEKIATQFTRQQALILSGAISFKPGQRYIQFPNNKVPIGSKYPTFTLHYWKGIAALGSDVDFDKWRFSVNDDKNLKLAGTFKYRVGVGGFLNDKKVPIQDYQHFNGNQTLGANEYLNSFQLAKYYANSTTAGFYSFGHVEHHFNGLLTNKIPLFKRLNWNLVAGSNAFFVNSKSNYVEVFAGLENILKIFRVDFVAAYENGRKGLTGIRIGTGGILGGSIQREKRRANIEMPF
ncbi:MAG: carboxypeptidase-like regulatory protein [Ferruginibacter sp.]|nr:carboxypeptidase-like regulatory protein [Ferruginibacter sp.]